MDFTQRKLEAYLGRRRLVAFPEKGPQNPEQKELIAEEKYNRGYEWRTNNLDQVHPRQTG